MNKNIEIEHKKGQKDMTEIDLCQQPGADFEVHLGFEKSFYGKAAVNQI